MPPLRSVGVRMPAAVLVLSLLLSASTPAAAGEGCIQSPCSLGDSLRLALESHPLMAAARENLAMFEARLKGARLSWLPQAGLRGYVSATPEKTGDPLAGETGYDVWGPYLRFEFSAYVPLYTFGKLSKLKEMAREGVDVGRAQQQVARAQVERMVVQAWFALRFSHRMSGILDEGEKYMKRARTFLEKLRDEDSEDYDDVDMLRLKVYESEVASLRLDASRLEQLALSGLAMLTGRPEEEFMPPGRLSPLPAEIQDLGWYVDRAMRSRGELLAVEAAMRAQGARVDLEVRRFLPDLFIGGFYTWARAFVVEQQPSPFAYDPYNSWFAGAGLGLKLDLDLASRLSGLDEERAGVRRLSAQRAALRQLVEIEVEKAWRELEDFQARLELNRTAYKAARGWAVAKLDLYESGMAPLKDLTDGLAEFFKRRMAYEQGVLDFNLGLAALAHACGLSLSELTSIE